MCNVTMNQRVLLPLACAALVGTTLIGCVTAAQQRTNKEAQGQPDPSALLAKSRSVCEEYGLKPDTDAFAGCVQAQSEAATARAAATRQRTRAISECKHAVLSQPTQSGFDEEWKAKTAECESDPTAYLRYKKQ